MQKYPVGRGGFGRVWKVERKIRPEIYAMKEMSKAKATEKNSIKMIQNELLLLKHIRHPFLINMHYAFQSREYLYIILDYMSGGDLRYHICRQRTFTEQQVKFFISCLLLALEYLHSNKLVHRDVKPENILFDEKGYLYLTDMGIVLPFDSNNSYALVDSSGTPGYMAPEVMFQQPHGFSCDFYAVGVIMHELMIGKVRFIYLEAV